MTPATAAKAKSAGAGTSALGLLMAMAGGAVLAGAGGPWYIWGALFLLGLGVAIRPGKVDRSPTGTALSARMAVLHARGQMGLDDRLTAVSLIGSTFAGRILGTTTVGGLPAIRPEISGRGWITGIHQHMLDPDDPWPEGYRLSDTWGAR